MSKLEEMSEVEEMAKQWMLDDGFAPTSLFLVGKEERMGYTFTDLPDGFDEKVQATVQLIGKEVAERYPEIGMLVRTYIVMNIRVKHEGSKLLGDEVLLIDGIDIGTGEKQSTAFAVNRNNRKVTSFGRLKVGSHIPDNPIMQPFVQGFNSYLASAANDQSAV